MSSTVILVGSTNGLQVVQEDALGNYASTARLLSGRWVTSISRIPGSDTACLVTTRDGYIATFEGFRVTTLAAVPMRLWFAHLAMDGTLRVGGRPAGLLESRDCGATWIQSGAIAQIASSRRWYSHSGGAAHLNTLCDDSHSGRSMFVAAEVGGVLHSDNCGREWVDITRDLDPDVHKIELNRPAADTLYAATGTGVFRMRLPNGQWELFGPPTLRYVQGIIYHPNRRELYISSAQKPYGRHSEGLYSATSLSNEFALFVATEDGHTWGRLCVPGRRLAGALSKAVSVESRAPHAVFAGCADGSLIRVGQDMAPKIVAEGLGQIECVGTIVAA
jgi:hypothetical protein